MRDLGRDLLRLVLAYAKQETIDPIKALARYVLWGLAGAVLLSIGLVLVGLAAVRLLQTEVHVPLSGDLTWVPYLGGVVIALAVAGLAVSRIVKAPR